MIASSQLYVQLPVGAYYATLKITYSTTGASAFAWSPNVSAQTGLNPLDITDPILSTKISSSSVVTLSAMRFTVTSGGVYVLFASGGTSTGWVVSTGATQEFLIVPLPSDTISLLHHSSPAVRSLAFCRLRDGQDKKDELKKEVADALRELGVERKYEPKPDKFAELIRAAHLEHINPTKAKRELTFEEKLARAHNMYKLEQDADWEISSQNDIKTSIAGL